ncbi:MAG: 50S ribosomal protein L4 [Acidobacteria bacterium]|nr:50S ribosomal protein L4 [Acidobacteriota bacterium]
MPTVEVKNLKNEVVGEIELSDAVFGAPANQALIYEAVKWFMAKQRAGTASTKTRGEVSGAGKKLWRQKGTGRARIGSIRSPLWRHGGTAHGPKLRDYAYTLPKKMVRGALRSALSEKLREGNLRVFDALTLSSHKTKELAKILRDLGLERKTLIVDWHENHNLGLASDNLPSVKLVESREINIFDALYYPELVFSQAAIKELEQLLAG